MDEEQGMTQRGTTRLGRGLGDVKLRRIHKRPLRWSRSARMYMVSTKDSRNKTQGLGSGTRFWAESGSRQQIREVPRMMTNNLIRVREIDKTTWFVRCGKQHASGHESHDWDSGREGDDSGWRKKSKAERNG